MKTLLIILLSLPFYTWANDTESFFELTYVAYSKHLITGRYNTNHNFLGLEYRNDQHGIGVATFKNSYYDQSTLITYTKYWQLANSIEPSLSVGYVSGYNYTNKGVIASVAYTKYDNFRPKISLFGGVLVFSMSFKF